MRDLKKKYQMLLAKERSWAASVARSGIKPRQLSVWEVLIPVLLIFMYAKSKTDREVMVQNLLFTKDQALKAARDMIENNTRREDALAPFLENTRGLLASVEEGIYSEAIRERQLSEIHILLDHYLKLFREQGENYETLVFNAYQTREAYAAFLDRLQTAEQAVNQAALETLGPRGNPEMVARMEKTYDRLRRTSAEKIFDPGGS